MRITVGGFDATTRTVPVTFSHDGVTHRRRVNALIDESGAYDRAATRARVNDVAAGVAEKIAAGLFADD